MNPLQNELKGVSGEEKRVRQEEEHHITRVRWRKMNNKLVEIYFDSVFRCFYSGLIEMVNIVRALLVYCIS